MSPTPAEERTPTDRDWHTAELPATPQRDFLIPATRWTEAPAALRELGADFGVELVAYKRRIGRYLLWRAGPAKGSDTRYCAIAADDLDRVLHVPAVPRRHRRGRRSRRRDAIRGFARGRNRCAMTAPA